MKQRRPYWGISIRRLFPSAAGFGHPSLAKLALTLCVLAGSFLGFSSLVRAQDDGPARRASAHTQFQRAEMMRAALEAKNERERSLQDYKNLVFEYRHVYLITPHAEEAPQALKEVGDLYRRMGEQFEKQYFNSAVETYEFLLHEYPTSRYREDALPGYRGHRPNRSARTQPCGTPSI